MVYRRKRKGIKRKMTLGEVVLSTVAAAP